MVALRVSSWVNLHYRSNPRVSSGLSRDLLWIDKDPQGKLSREHGYFRVGEMIDKSLPPDGSGVVGASESSGCAPWLSLHSGQRETWQFVICV